MAEDRILPNLKTRLTLDTVEVAKGKQAADQLHASLASAGDGAKAGGDKVTSGLTSPLRVLTDVAGVVAAKKIFDFGKAGFEEMKQAAQVSAQTTNELKNIGPAAGISVAGVKELSEAMLRQSGVDDEVVQGAINTELRMGLTGDAIRRVTQDANDLSQSFGDMSGDAELLSKALAHPEQAARLLKPAIGGLTDAQLASIAAFHAQGDEAAAGNVILDAVEAKVKGAAAAYGETLPGKVAIAQESLKNIKAELVAGSAPALSLAANATTFLIGEFDKLPDSSKAVVGGVVLVGSGVGALVRPVGDVVRLYEQWRARSEEVTAAQEALAAAETQEATASAAGAASSATATGVTIASTTATNEAAAAAARRVVSNEALTFSDEEIVAAETARRDAELLSLVSNDALIASDAELVAANTAAAASTAEYALSSGAAGASALSLSGALVLTVAGAAIATGVYSALSDVWNTNAKGVDEYTAALEKNTGKQAENLDAVTANKVEQSGAADIASRAGISFETLFQTVRDGNEDWGAAKRAVGAFRDESDAIPQSGHDIAAALRDAGLGSSEFGRQLIAAADAGQISGAEVYKLLSNVEGLHNGLGLANIEAAKHKTLLDAVTNASKDTSTATETHARSVDSLRTATDQLTDAEKLELAQADAAATAHKDFAGFIDDTASAMDRQYQSLLGPTQLLDDYKQNINGLIDSLKKEGPALDASSDSSGRYNDHALANISALEQTGISIAKLVEQKFRETHSVEDATNAGAIYVENLKNQLREAGYNSTQIEQMIEIMHLTPDEIRTTFTTNGVEAQAIVQRYKDSFKDIPTEKRTEIAALIDQGKLDQANAILDDLSHGRSVDFTVNIHGGGQIYLTDSATGVTTSEVDITARNIPHMAHGGHLEAGDAAWVGDKFGMDRAELFVADVPGQVYAQGAGFPGFGGGPPSTYEVHLHVDGEMSAAQEWRLRDIAHDAAMDVFAELVPSGR